MTSPKVKKRSVSGPMDWCNSGNWRPMNYVRESSSHDEAKHLASSRCFQTKHKEEALNGKRASVRID